MCCWHLHKLSRLQIIESCENLGWSTKNHWKYRINARSLMLISISVLTVVTVVVSFFFYVFTVHRSFLIPWSWWNIFENQVHRSVWNQTCQHTNREDWILVTGPPFWMGLPAWSWGPGRSSCTDCLAGYYLPTSGQSICLACESGHGSGFGACILTLGWRYVFTRYWRFDQRGDDFAVT